MKFLVNTRNPDGGVSYHRLQEPFKDFPYPVDFFIMPEEVKNIRQYSHLVFNRSFGWANNEADQKFIEWAKTHGVKIIIDLDDYWVLPEYHTIRWRPDVDYEVWQSAIIENLKLADYAWTTTEYLRGKIKEINDIPIAIARNALNYDDPQWKKPVNKSNDVNIGWIGSTTHHMDLDMMRRPLAMLDKWAKKSKIKIMKHLAGYSKGSGWAGEVSKRFYSNFTNNGQYQNIHLIKPVHVANYGYLYGLLDISIAPVLENEFNKSKSELKVIEAGARRIPFIGSDVITYSRTGANIDLCSNSDEWFNSMKELTSSKSLRQELGKELGEYVRDEYTFKKENESRLSIL